MSWDSLLPPSSFSPFSSSCHLFLPGKENFKERKHNRLCKTSFYNICIDSVTVCTILYVYSIQHMLCVPTHHHEHILADAFAQTVRELVWRGLCLGFVYVRGLFHPRPLLEADPSCIQLQLHEMLKVLVDMSSGVRPVQVPHVLLGQRLLVALHRHPGETRTGWKLQHVLPAFWGDSYEAMID